MRRVAATRSLLTNRLESHRGELNYKLVKRALGVGPGDGGGSAMCRGAGGGSVCEDNCLVHLRLAVSGFACSRRVQVAAFSDIFKCLLFYYETFHTARKY